MTAKKRTVVRKYFSKRRNEWVTKTYEYNAKKVKRSDLIVGKSGKVYKDRLNKLRDSLDDPNDKYELDLIIEKAIINTGYTPEELAAEMGIDVMDLLDEDNWDGSTFSFGGDSWDFEFRYDGSVMNKRIKK